MTFCSQNVIHVIKILLGVDNTHKILLSYQVDLVVDFPTNYLSKIIFTSKISRKSKYLLILLATIFSKS